MSGRAGKVLAVVVGVLVLLAVVAGVISATRERPELPAGSPEATVQDYVTLIYDDDLEGAAELLDPDGSCTVEDLDLAFVDQAARVVLRDTSVDGDRATVRVGLVHPSGSPLGDEFTQDETFRLVRSPDGWVITGDPWPVYGCGKEPHP
ncbi:hypothetical protein [Ornithinimicrobium tianjinense]|uniref:Uncharacterized protein n=1 Tax=Ornithinimicrobium tianjinense TaxID=1195761 RepID=A0A917BJJ0_9MICO|nr:hypothetical protein [Ornithinimicrobium tianjinense]GGF45682.1 hypothetical protein GCM10011366_11780 [Ornithinimicrobium tianjinense]